MTCNLIQLNHILLWWFIGPSIIITASCIQKTKMFSYKCFRFFLITVLK